MINKRQFRIANDKKLLHKVGKHWVVLSAMAIALLGGGTIAGTTTARVNADEANQPKVVAPQSNNAQQQNAANDPKAIEKAASQKVQTLMLGASQGRIKGSNLSQSKGNQENVNAQKLVTNTPKQGVSNGHTMSLGSTSYYSDNLDNNYWIYNDHQKTGAAYKKYEDYSIIHDWTSDTYDGLKYHYDPWNFAVEIMNGSYNGGKSTNGFLSGLISHIYSDSSLNNPVSLNMSLKIDSDASFSGVSDMSSMFANCPDLHSIIINTNTSAVNNMKNMFANDQSTSINTGLTDVYFGKNFDASHATNHATSGMFTNDNNLSKVVISTANTKLDNSEKSLYKINSDGKNTSYVPYTFTKGNTGTYVSQINPDADENNWSNIYSINGSSQPGLNEPANSDKAPSDWIPVDASDQPTLNKDDYSYVTSSGEISSSKTGNKLRVAPYYRGLIYKVNNNDSGVTFTGGNLYNANDFIANAPEEIRDAGKLTFGKIHIRTDSLQNMFKYAFKLSDIDFGNDFDTSGVTDMNSMFYQDNKLTSIEFPSNGVFKTNDVTDMHNMFQGDTSLRSLKLPESFDTSNVTSMKNMFIFDSDLNSLQLPESFNTRKVQNMSYMFDGDKALAELTLPKDFTTNDISTKSDMQQMFKSDGLKTLKLQASDQPNIPSYITNTKPAADRTPSDETNSDGIPYQTANVYLNGHQLFTNSQGQGKYSLQPSGKYIDLSTHNTLNSISGGRKPITVPVYTLNISDAKHSYQHYGTQASLRNDIVKNATNVSDVEGKYPGYVASDFEHLGNSYGIYLSTYNTTSVRVINQNGKVIGEPTTTSGTNSLQINTTHSYSVGNIINDIKNGKNGYAGYELNTSDGKNSGVYDNSDTSDVTGFPGNPVTLQDSPQDNVNYTVLGTPQAIDVHVIGKPVTYNVNFNINLNGVSHPMTCQVKGEFGDSDVKVSINPNDYINKQYTDNNNTSFNTTKSKTADSEFTKVFPAETNYKPNQTINSGATFNFYNNPITVNYIGDKDGQSNQTIKSGVITGNSGDTGNIIDKVAIPSGYTIDSSKTPSSSLNYRISTKSQSINVYLNGKKAKDINGNISSLVPLSQSNAVANAKRGYITEEIVKKHRGNIVSDSFQPESENNVAVGSSFELNPKQHISNYTLDNSNSSRYPITGYVDQNGNLQPQSNVFATFVYNADKVSVPINFYSGSNELNNLSTKISDHKHQSGNPVIFGDSINTSDITIPNGYTYKSGLGNVTSDVSGNVNPMNVKLTAKNSDTVPVIFYIDGTDPTKTSDQVGSKNISMSDQTTGKTVSVDTIANNNKPNNYSFANNNVLTTLQNYIVGSAISGNDVSGGGFNNTSATTTTNPIYVPVTQDKETVNINFQYNGNTIYNDNNALTNQAAGSTIHLSNLGNSESDVLKTIASKGYHISDISTPSKVVSDSTTTWNVPVELTNENVPVELKGNGYDKSYSATQSHVMANVVNSTNITSQVSRLVPNGYTATNVNYQAKPSDIDTTNYDGTSHSYDNVKNPVVVNLTADSEHVPVTYYDTTHHTNITGPSKLNLHTGEDIDSSNAQVPNGYTYASASPATVTVNNDGSVQPVTIDVTPKPAGEITVKYINQNGNVLNENGTVNNSVNAITGSISGKTDDTGNVYTSHPIPTGYQYSSANDTGGTLTAPNSSNVGYTMGTQPQIINIHVNGNHVSDTFTITRHKDVNGTVTSDQVPVKVSGNVGDPFTIKPTNYTPTGYTSESNSVSGSINPTGLSTKSATFDYDANQAEDLTVNYVDQNNQPIGTPQAKPGYVDENVHITPETISGYHLDTNQAQSLNYKFGVNSNSKTIHMTGNAINGSVKVNVIYKESNGHSDTSKQLTVPINGYVGKSDMTINPNSYYNDGYNSNYKLYANSNSSKTIKFTPDEAPSGDDNNYHPSDITFTYIATTAKPVTIQYENDGQPIGTPLTITGIVGQTIGKNTINGQLHAPANYTLSSSTPVNNDVVLSSNSQTIPVDVNPNVEHDTVNYKDSTGNSIKSNVQINGSYNSSAKSVIDDNKPTNWHVTNGDDVKFEPAPNNVINVTVAKDITTDKVVYIYKGTPKGAMQSFNNVNVGSDVNVTSGNAQLPNGYRLVNANNNVGYNNGQPNDVAITPITATDTITYVDQNGHQVGNSQKYTGNDSQYHIGTTSFNANDHVPANYHSVSDTTFNYDNHPHTVTIAPDSETDDVNYIDPDGSHVKNTQIQGNYNSDAKGAIDAKLPAHYHVVSGDTGVFTHDGTFNVKVSNDVTDKIVLTGDVNNHTTSTGAYGTKGTASIPNGYHITNGNGQFTYGSNDGTHTFNVAKNAPTTAKVTISYVLSGSNVPANYVGKRGTINTVSDTKDVNTNANDFINGNVPANYHIVSGNTGVKYDGQSHTVQVAPDNETVHVTYHDTDNNGVITETGQKTVDANPISGQYGTQVNVTNAVPAGYHASDTSLYTINSSNPSVTRNIAGDTQTVNVTVKEHDGSKLIPSNKQVQGPTGTHYSIDPTAYVPSGYQNDSSNQVASGTFQPSNNQTVIFNYDKAPVTPAKTTNTATVVYKYNDNKVASDKLTGRDGDQFTIDNSNKPNLPSNYKLVNPSQSFNYDGGTYNVAVEPNSVNPTPKPTQTTKTDTINYQSDGKTIASGQATGNANASFTISNSNAPQLPSGYHVIGNQMFTYDGNGHDVAVAKNSNPAPKPTPKPTASANATVHYVVDGNNSFAKHGQTLNSNVFNGKQDTSLTIGANPTNLPNGYSIENPNQNLTYNNGSDDVTIKPNLMNDQIHYQVSGNSAENSSTTSQGYYDNQGSVTAPNGYHFVNGSTGQFTYGANGGVHTFDVAKTNNPAPKPTPQPQPQPSTQSTATIDYQYHGQTLRQGHFTGTKGTNVNNVNSQVPNAYHVVNADQTIQFDGNTHNVAVVPNQATDTINYQSNGKTLASAMFTGNSIDAQGASDTTFTVDGNNEPNLPSGYQLANPSTTFTYDGTSHDVQVEPVKTTPVTPPNPVTPVTPNSGAVTPQTPVQPASSASNSVAPSSASSTGSTSASQSTQSNAASTNNNRANNASQTSQHQSLPAHSKVTNKGFVVTYNHSKHGHDVATYHGRKYAIHYNSNGKNTIRIKKNGHYKNVVVGVNKPVAQASPSVVRAVDMVNFNAPAAKHVFTAKGFNKAMNQLPAGKVIKYHGRKIARLELPLHWRYFMVTKNALAHFMITSIGKVTTRNLLSARHTYTIFIKHIVAVHGRKANYVRYEFSYKHHDFWVTARKDFVPNSYLQPRNFKARDAHYVRVDRPCRLYTSRKYGERTLVRNVPRGTVARVVKVINIKPRHKSYEQTRLLLSNGDYITANKNFVKIV